MGDTLITRLMAIFRSGLNSLFCTRILCDDADPHCLLALLHQALGGQALDTLLNIPKGARDFDFVVQHLRADFDRSHPLCLYDALEFVQDADESIARLVTRIKTHIRKSDRSDFLNDDEGLDRFLCRVFDKSLNKAFYTKSVHDAHSFNAKVAAATEYEFYLDHLFYVGHRADC